MNWEETLKELAKKVKPIHAFGILFVIGLIWALATYGDQIPKGFQALIYIVVIACLILVGIDILTPWLRSRKPAPIVKPDPEDPPPPGPHSEPAQDIFTAREEYLRAVVADCRRMRLVGLDPQAADPSKGGMTLEKLYISLDTTIQVEEEDEDQKNRKRAAGDFQSGEPRRPLSAVEALSNNPKRQIVLLGLPGTGKSTFVRYLSLGMAQTGLEPEHGLQDRVPGWQGEALLPVMISLGRLAETLSPQLKKGHAKLIEDYLVKTLESDLRTAGYASYILKDLGVSGALVLFDGLDEVANLELRPIVVQAVEDFTARYGAVKTSRFMVTCRTFSYYNDARWQLSGWTTYELAEFDPEKIKAFVQAWHTELIYIDPGRKAEYSRKQAEMLASLQPDDRRKLYEVAPNPLVLTMMAIVHTHSGTLPDTRAQVYDRCVDLLLVRWEQLRPVTDRLAETERPSIIDALGGQRVSLESALSEIAFKAHKERDDTAEEQRKTALVTGDLLSAVLPRYFKLEQVNIFLDYCQSSNGLLMYQGTIALAGEPADAPPHKMYAFPHLTFEEYLAALYLIELPDFENTACDLLRQSDRWREVIMLMGEHLCFATKPAQKSRMQTLLNTLTPKKQAAQPTKADWNALWLAGDLLILYRRAFPQEQAEAEPRILQGLQNLIAQGALVPQSRARAADTLDELGWLPQDLHRFLPVTAAGKTVFVARYPVTNAQYARFLIPENFTDRTLWCDFWRYDPDGRNRQTTGQEGWEWLRRAKEVPDYDQDGEILLPRYWRDPRFGLLRHGFPVVGISWWEANAYCRWLQRNWSELKEGQENSETGPLDLVRLPLESEWESAAGGSIPKNRYPWEISKEESDADAEILQRANTWESMIFHTTPVGMYPSGASEPWKIMDMAGNVWEWQANGYSQSDKRPALRGGSWSFNREGARAGGRGGRYPDYRDNLIGFRVVALPKVFVP